MAAKAIEDINHGEYDDLLIYLYTGFDVPLDKLLTNFDMFLLGFCRDFRGEARIKQLKKKTSSGVWCMEKHIARRLVYLGKRGESNGGLPRLRKTGK